MITIDFVYALALFSVGALIFLFGIWCLARQQQKKEMFLDPRFIWFCAVCTYSYINTKDEAISLCPRCGSYNRK
jgi:uncharacterized membrane protein YiaA